MYVIDGGMKTFNYIFSSLQDNGNGWETPRGNMSFYNSHAHSYRMRLPTLTLPNFTFIQICLCITYYFNICTCMTKCLNLFVMYLSAELNFQTTEETREIRSSLVFRLQIVVIVYRLQLQITVIKIHISSYITTITQCDGYSSIVNSWSSVLLLKN